MYQMYIYLKQITYTV